MFRIKKGHHGYIKRKKRLLLGEVLGLLIGIIGLVVIGVVTTGSRKKFAYSCGYGFSNTNGKSACHFDCTLEISAVPR